MMNVRIGLFALVVALLFAAAVPAGAHDGFSSCGGHNSTKAPGQQVPPQPWDLDCDSVDDQVDNCPPLGYDDIRTRNPNQADSDNDGIGDWCESDDDNDGVNDWKDGKVEYESRRQKLDNCRTIPNPGQEDDNQNGVGNLCEFDDDKDGTFNTEDNCPRDPNPDQADMDGDGLGDVCDLDQDGDLRRDVNDNCPRFPNPDQTDRDGDGRGAPCDPDGDDPPAPPVAPDPPPAPVPVASTSGPPPGPPDRFAPQVSARLSSTQHLDDFGDVLIVRVTCSEACTVKAELSVDRKVARKLRLRGTTVVGAGAARLEGAATTYAFVRFDRKVRSRLVKLRRARATLKVSVTDPSGNARSTTRRVTLVR
jgi:hypothetical protein